MAYSLNFLFLPSILGSPVCDWNLLLSGYHDGLDCLTCVLEICSQKQICSELLSSRSKYVLLDTHALILVGCVSGLLMAAPTVVD